MTLAGFGPSSHRITTQSESIVFREHLHAHSPSARLHYVYSLSTLDHPFTLICDITWENGEYYIKPRFKFVLTVERKLKKIKFTKIMKW